MELTAALIQLTSSDDPGDNLAGVEARLREAAAAGARLALTPEVTNCVSASRTHQQEVLTSEAEDAMLARLRMVAHETGLWISLGSIAVTTDDPDGRFANRSMLLTPDGEIAARYDKIHMFDVEIDETESYRESAGFRPGERAVVAESPWGPIGLTICYDIRFPALYRRLAEAGAHILTVPAAFTVPTGRAHWHTLLRARAIETGCFVLAAAQWGEHPASRGRSRETFGHSLAIDPWGRILADAGEGEGVTLVTLDLDEVARSRGRVPALANARAFDGP